MDLRPGHGRSRLVLATAAVGVDDQHQREEVAQRLVIEGFMSELIERFEEGDVRDALAAAIDRRLEAVLG